VINLKNDPSAGFVLVRNGPHAKKLYHFKVDTPEYKSPKKRTLHYLRCNFKANIFYA
jgi:hypothetical protein